MADEARVLDALGDSTRRAVLELLRGGEQSVRELTDATAVSQPAVSQHLRVLRDAGLVTVRPDGARRLVERAVDGRTSVWGEVLAREPPHRLVLTWHPGGDPDDASEVEVRFTASEGGGTRVELEHRGWERFGESAMLRRHAYVGPGAWGLLLDHVALKRPRDDRRGARAGGARAHGPGLRQHHLPGPPGAHRLGRGDRRPHRARGPGRELAEVSMAATARLDPDQLATAVPCRLFHDGALVLDDAMPWARLAPATQGSVHLPAHTGQLRDLRR